MKLRNIKSKEVVKILTKRGFEIKRQSGTHVILRNNGRMVVVPIHNETIPIGTLKSIEKQSGINFREAIW
jgi:predicted RNA binding protein YcfA (HicA-like mRNA interferase family)